MKKNIFAIIFSTISFFSYGKELKPSDKLALDSLQKVYLTADSKCDKALVLMESVEIIYQYNRDSVLFLCDLAIDLLKDKTDSSCLMTLGIAYNNIGVVNDDNGQIMDAIKAYEKSILILEKVGDEKGIATSYTNIGYIYKTLHEFDKCLDYNKKALAYRMNIGDVKSISNSLNNIGFVYRNLNELDSALYYYQTSYELRKLLGNTRGMAFSLNNIGAMYDEKGEIERSLDYYLQSLNLHRESNSALSNTMVNIGEAYFKLDKFQNAKLYADSAMKFATQSGRPERIKVASKLSFLVYEELGQLDKAFKFQKIHYQMVDSIESHKLHDKVVLEEAKFRFIRDHIKDSVSFAHKQEVLDEIHSKEMNAEKQKSRYELIGIIILVVLIVILIIAYQYKIRTQAKLSSKNEQLSSKNYQITNSINYAKKIQKAVLKYDEDVIKKLRNHFLYYKPKEIVSGDFYWFYTEGTATYMAVADCSGHGVPAGFLSMLGIRILNEIVGESSNNEPSEILNQLSAKFVKALNQTGEIGHSFDGMDIVLIKLDSSEPTKLTWAGASRPLISVNSNGNVAINKPSNIGAIGFFQGENRFVNNELKISKGDMIYLCSDGYTDQFGGEKMKKYGYHSLSAVLEGIHKLDLESQHQVLMENHQTWKASESQLDDICMLGVRI